MRENPETLLSFPLPPFLPTLLLAPFPFPFSPPHSHFLSISPAHPPEPVGIHTLLGSGKHAAAGPAWGQGPVLTFHVGRYLAGQRLP